MTVIDLQAYRQRVEQSIPHCTGEARCTGCDHTWEAVAEVGAVWLQCPECGTLRGLFVRAVTYQPGTHCLQCDNCGGSIFEVSRTDDLEPPLQALCVRCGVGVPLAP